MRNLGVTIVCLVLGMMTSDCRAISLLRRRKSDAKLKSFTDRYALPSNVHLLTSKLPLTFGYRFTDDYGTMQSREEKTDPNGSKTGSYSFVDATGLYRKVEYVADRYGFRATVTTNEPGTLSVDPAHVRMLTDNKHISLGALNHETGIAPQLEFSSHIFSRYNLTHGFEGERKGFPHPTQFLENFPKVVIPKSPVFESERVPLDKQNVHDANSYKQNPVPFSPEISSLIKELDDPGVVQKIAQNVNSNDYFDNGPKVHSDYAYGDKISSGQYKKKVPTRYPRRQRARSKKRHVLRIHIPKGYEDHHDLPLYRDK